MRQMTLTMAVALSILSFLPNCQAQAQQAPAPVTLSKLADRVYEVLEGRGARGGAYVGDDAVLLIDTKMDKESVDQTLAAVKQVTDRPVRYVINTHSDFDHVRGNQYMPDGVVFIAHQNCRQEFFLPGRDGKPSEWADPALARFIPAVTYSDRADLHLGQVPVELWYFGKGHTSGDTVVYIREAKIAFLGDQFFTGRPQLIHVPKGGNSFEHVRTLRKMLDTLDATTFCSGHSAPVDRSAVLKHIAEMEERQARVKAFVEQGKSLEEAKAAFPGNEAALVQTVWNEVVEKR
jgi:cyclase